MPQKSKKRSPSRTQRILAKIDPVLTPAREALYELNLFLGAASGWHPMSISEYEDRLAGQQWREKKERIQYLKERKWIETKKIGKKLMVRLTEKGWQQVLRDHIRCTKVMCKDGVCILVIFDVPESQRHVRDTLRWILSECGFTMLQKSVWYTNKDVLEPLCALLQGAKLNKWVRIIVGNEFRQSMIKNAVVRLHARQKSAKSSRS
ncbi:CRISPR-associated endonuclease Cas2 [Candidatus Uhrbacteria bacterium]|nr:CRISPR-associated endonuclease Cas2 [Candidatus Uhrbacteria bacterium]